MDPVKVEKFRAMVKYKKTNYLHKVALYAVTPIMVGLFLSSPLWLSPLCFFIKSLLCVSLPNMMGYILCPKFLFVVSNVIIVVLVGESKFLGTSSPKPDIYDEYVKRKNGSQKLHAPPMAKKETTTTHFYEDKSVIERSVMKVTSEEVREEDDWEVSKDEDDAEELQTEKGVEEEEEEGEMPVDELNRKVEDFIARFNQQRRLEAKLLLVNGPMSPRYGYGCWYGYEKTGTGTAFLKFMGKKTKKFVWVVMRKVTVHLLFDHVGLGEVADDAAFVYLNSQKLLKMPYQGQPSAVVRSNGLQGKELMKFAVGIAWRVIATTLGDYFGLGTELAVAVLHVAWPFIKKVIKKGIRKLLRATVPALSDHLVPALADAALNQLPADSQKLLEMPHQGQSSAVVKSNGFKVQLPQVDGYVDFKAIVDTPRPPSHRLFVFKHQFSHEEKAIFVNKMLLAATGTLRWLE
ncbi:hypothetical protein EJ110_NYTH49576, partial [Nymphaea thermarum]